MPLMAMGFAALGMVGMGRRLRRRQRADDRRGLARSILIRW
jgi:hypothetical protein